MMIYLEWIVWAIMVIFTVIMFVTWVFKKKSYQDRHFYNTDEVVTLYSIPRIAIAETVLLLIFLFININKLHLLWLYPIMYFFINYRMAQRVQKADEERIKKK